MIIKLVGLGIKEYARDRFNLLDALIVFVSVLDITLDYSGVISGSGSLISIFRAIRIIRIVKLSKDIKSFRVLLGKIVSSFEDIFTFAVLLGIFIVIFMVLGMQFFAYTVFIDSETDLITAEAEGGESPRSNFDNVYNAFVTVFAVMVGDDWNQIMYSYYRVHGIPAMLFFISVMLVTNIVLLNLLLALLLANFTEDPSQGNNLNRTTTKD